MTYKEIIDLIKLVNKTDLAEIKIQDGDFRLSIRSKDYLGKSSISDMTVPPVSFTPIPAGPATAPAPPPQAAPASPETKTEEPEASTTASLLEIKSPIVGTFYRSSSPEKGAYAKVGDDIKAGDVVCIVEAMKLFNEIESEVSGKIVKVLVEDASPVEYDQVLFLVDPS
jgi:acetyl-CoA carboxylase biotin carboxyl carrier protein